MMTYKYTLVLVAMLAALTACHSTPSAQVDNKYDTVANHLSRDTQHARQLNAQGLDLLKHQQYDDAETAFKRALSVDLTYGPAHNNLGKIYYFKKRYYLAAWEFQYAAKLMPTRPEPRNNLGLVFEAVGKLDDAIDNYQQAMQLAPDDVQVIGNLARARLRRGDTGPPMRKLLTNLLMKETRPDWRQWEREQLALMPTSDVTPKP